MPVSKRTRYEVLKRDNHTCRYCGGTAPDVVLTIDHVAPVALGGSDLPENLVAACKDCNAGKTSTSPSDPLVADVKQDALRWAAAMKLAGERKAAQTRLFNEYGTAFYRLWERFCDEMDPNIAPPVLPDGWTTSIHGFYQAGLPISELLQALILSMNQGRVGRYDKFRYMCGIAWNVLREIQKDAQTIVEAK